MSIINELEKTASGTVKNVYIVDSFNKRKLKKSVPTAILNIIENYPDSTIKDIENKAVNLVAVKNGFTLAVAVAVAKGNESFTIRAFARRRIIAVIRYYTALDVVKGVFNGLNPIVKRADNGIDRYTLGIKTD